MSKLSTLFNVGLKLIEEQAELLDDESERLLLETGKAQEGIDEAVKELQTTRDGIQQAKDNIRWLQIEIFRKSNHSFNELNEFYTLLDDNEQDLTIFEWLESEHKPVAVSKLRVVIAEYQDHIDSYQDEIDTLESLIYEHGSESNLEQLQEVADKYNLIVHGQIETVNRYLAKYDIEAMVR